MNDLRVIADVNANGVNLIFANSYDLKDTLKARGYRYGEYLVYGERNPVKGWAKLGITDQTILDNETEWVNANEWEVEVFE